MLHSHHLPAEARPQVVDLAGQWRMQAGDEPGWLAPDFDDSGWPEAAGPAARVEGKRLVARRVVDLSPGLASQPLFLTFGELGRAHAELYVNGRLVGSAGEPVHDLKLDLNSLEGFDLPPEVVHPGRNLLALRFLTEARNDPKPLGAKDRRLYLGAAAHLEPFFLKARGLADFLLVGPVYALLILAVLLGSLLAIEWGGERRRYATALGVILATGFYLALRAGFPFTSLSVLHRLQLAPFSVALSGLAIAEFAGSYFFERAPLLLKLNRAVCALMMLALCVLDDVHGLEVYKWYARWSFLVVGYFLYVTARSLWERPRTGFSAPMLGLGFLQLTGAGVVDLLGDLGHLQAPRLFPIALSVLPFIVAFVVVAEFLRISGLNRSLAVSLQQSNAELATALAAARESTRVKGEFLANVSHELRTPLNSIINIPEGILEQFREQRHARCPGCGALFELEADEPADPSTPCPDCARPGLELRSAHRFEGDPAEAVHFLKTIRRSGAHLLSVVNEILDYSKLEAGRMVLQVGPVELSQLLAEARSTVLPIAEKRGIRIDLEGETAGASVQADPVKLAQVLINLLANAVKFSPDGGRVLLSCASEDAAWVFRVRDWGIGIAPEHQKLLFESFRQVDGSSTRKHGGTGLGLAISKKLVEMHGGAIGVDSAPGQGSTFWVRLPTSGAPAQPASDAPVVLPGARKRVLVVDDDPVACETVSLALRRLDLEVVSLLDPRAASEDIARRPPDLLLLDVMMPRVSGLTVLREVRAQPATRDLPVLVVSAYHSNREVAEALGARWVPKPWNGKDLADEVERILKLSKS